MSDAERRAFETRLTARNGGYRIENGTVFWLDKKISRADAATFSPQHFWWAKDSNRVFACGKWVKSADPATFTALNFAFARDNEYAYDRTGRVIPGANAAALRVLDAGMTRDANGYLTGGGYATDGAAVFYAEHSVQALKPPPNAGAFQCLGGSYAGDADRIYFESRHIPGADPGTFAAVSRRFARDVKHVYFGAKRITNADPTTFTVTGDYIDTARDKNGRFDWQTVSIVRTP